MYACEEIFLRLEMSAVYSRGPRRQNWGGGISLDPSPLFDPHRARTGRKVERTEMS